VDPMTDTGVVGEVKLNWKDGRDEKLLGLYLEAVTHAFGLRAVWPVLVTSNIRGYAHPVKLGLGDLLSVDYWTVGQPTPLLLVP
jgi:hypothetical protein